MNSPQSSLRLYTTLKSGPGRKVLAVSHVLGLSPKVENVDVYVGEGQREAYRVLNPFGKVPTLVDGDFVLWESNAIALYLAEQHGDYRLSARDPRGRADILRWMFWESSHFQPAFGPVLTEFVSTALTRGRAHADPACVAWKTPPLWSLCGFLDLHLDAHANICGDQRTVADFALAGMLTYARAARFPFEALPNLARWFEAIEATPAWQATQCSLWT